MITNDADRRLMAWLEAEAPPREPEHLLEAVLLRTERTPRRPAWRIPERWTSMTTITTPVATGGRGGWALPAVIALVVLALVASLLVVAGNQPARVPAPFGSAANGKLVYEGGDDLLWIDPATGATGTIVATPAFEIVPQFSRDGTQLAWWQGGNPSGQEVADAVLTVARADGSGAAPLGTFQGPSSYAWSPSGDRIAVESLIDGRSSITVVDVASGRATALPIGFDATEPAFRPNGTELVFRGREGSGPWGLYIVGVDGADPRRLPLDEGFEEDRNYAENADFYLLDPAWSPDGKRLAFHTLEESLADPDPGFRVHVAAIDPSGNVTGQTTLPTEIAVDDEFQAAWLPDGSGLLTHRVEEVDHQLIRWTLGDGIKADGPGRALDTGRIRGNTLDFWFVGTPDGASALVWQERTPAVLVPMSGGPAVQTAIQPGPGASWQRTAP
ncbi:MAG: TolB family protein [Chloroflexota bacterium]